MLTFKCHVLYILALVFYHISTFTSKISQKCQNAGYKEEQKCLAQEQIHEGTEF